jgi:hypothetical protein
MPFGWAYRSAIFRGSLCPELSGVIGYETTTA